MTPIYTPETMIRLNDVRNLIRSIRYSNRPGETRYWLRDTSGGLSSGYSFDLVSQECRDFLDEDGSVLDRFWYDVATIASSFTVSLPDVRNQIGGLGAYGPAFNKTDVSFLL